MAGEIVNFGEGLERAEVDWAFDFVPESKLPIKDEAKLLNELEKRLTLIWYLRKQIDVQRQAMENQVRFVKDHYEGKIASMEASVEYLSGAPIAALKEIRERKPSQKSLSVPHGRVQSRNNPETVDWGDEAELLAQLKECGMAWAIRVREEVDKAAIKSRMTVLDRKVFAPQTPDPECEDLIELLGVRLEKHEPTYTIVTIKGGEK